MRIRTLFLLGASSLLTTACGSIWPSGDPSNPNGQPPESVGWATSALLPVKDCGELRNFVLDDQLAQMRRAVEQQRAYAHQSSYCSYYGSSDAGAAYASAGAAENDSTDTASKSSEATSVSKTNNQVAGVDEADFVKNDNKYLYVAKGDKLRIIEAWPAASAHEIGSFSVKGEARKLFVDGDRAVIYSAVQKPGASSYKYGGYSYGYYGNASTGDGTSTEITVLDIHDHTAPKVLRTLSLSGSLIAARLIGNAVHTVVTDGDLSQGGNWSAYASTSCNASSAEIDEAYDALLASNELAIRKAGLGALPTLTDTVSGGTEVASCQGFYRSQLNDGFAITSVVSFDMANDLPHSASSIVSRAGTIYASADSLFLALSHEWSEYGVWFEGASEKELSTVHRFSIGTDASATRYQASGTVEGRVLNQFSMDAHNGALRIATTTGYLPNPDAHNTLTVLSQEDSVLKQVGRIDNIAPSEDIRSVRFDGDRGFIVTFKKTDPLFALDLSDPKNPSILGELKIPGFSTYMHLMDPTHLLAIGYDADDQGSFAWFAGINLQIFDVTKMTDPKLLWKETIGTRGSSSEALDDHLAFNYFAEKKLLALPMTICEGGSGGSYGTDMTFSGLMVYDVSVENGFKLRGRVSHPYTPSASYGDDLGSAYNSACYTWWQDANSQVKRSVFMDNFVYSISNSLIKVNELSNLSVDVTSVALP